MKKLSPVLAMILVFAALTGCGGRTETLDMTSAEAAKTIVDSLTFRNPLVEAPKEYIPDIYTFDDKVTEVTVYVGSIPGVTAEEVAVVKSSDVESAKAALQKRIDDLKFSYGNYTPEEMKKLDSPVIVAKGGAAILVLADDTAKAQEVVDGLFKKNN